MTIPLPSAVENFLNITETLNGATTPEGTTDDLLNLFSKIAACRSNLQLAQELFTKAVAHDEVTAFQILFWARNARGGQGERAVFRALFEDAVTYHSDAVRAVLPLVAEYGRWDDLLCLEDTKVWPHVLQLLGKQLAADCAAAANNGVPSLLAKWLPSANASSTVTKRRARKLYNHLGWNEKTYRKTLVAVRRRIQIVEHAMCSGDWGSIDYSRVPSKAMTMYRRTFAKRDSNRFAQFLADVKVGKSKINTGTLFPYELVKPYLKSRHHWDEEAPKVEADEVLEAQWNALPNMMPEAPFNGLVVADVSGSMCTNNSLPLSVSVSLALYLAERNTSSVYGGKFLTFTNKPSLETVVGNSLAERVHNLSQSDWGYNTNLVAVFQTVLDAAKANQITQSDMPEKLIIVSDMQFDQACESNDNSNFAVIRQMYADAGYTMPQLVFWDVAASGKTAPFTTDEGGNCQLVSGCSPSILKAVLEGNSLTARQLMDEVLEPYAPVAKAIQHHESGMAS